MFIQVYQAYATYRNGLKKGDIKFVSIILSICINFIHIDKTISEYGILFRICWSALLLFLSLLKNELEGMGRKASSLLCQLNLLQSSQELFICFLLFLCFLFARHLHKYYWLVVCNTMKYMKSIIFISHSKHNYLHGWNVEL